MRAMPAKADVTAALSEWVFDEGRVVPYKVLSQAFGLKSTEAQEYARSNARLWTVAHRFRGSHRILATFVESNASKVSAVYLLSGGARNDSSRHVVRLVPGDELAGV